MMARITSAALALTLAAAPAWAQSARIAFDTFACAERGTVERLVRYQAQGDKTARDALYIEALGSGACIVLASGTPVFVSDGGWDGIVKVRRAGQPAEWWAVSTAVK